MSRLLQDAESQGLLERLDGEHVRLLPLLRQGANDLMAKQFLLAVRCAQSVAADIAKERVVA